MGEIVPFRTGCQYNHGKACLAKVPQACICRRPKQLLNPMFVPGRDAGSLANVSASSITEASLRATSDEIKRSFEPEAYRAHLRAGARRIVPPDYDLEVEKRDLIACAKSGGPIIIDDSPIVIDDSPITIE